MNVLSISSQRDTCGIANYARELDVALKDLGYDTTLCGPWVGLARLIAGRYDRILIQHELVTAIKQLELLPIALVLFLCALRKIRPTVVTHTILAPSHFRNMGRIFRQGFMWYQRASLRFFARLTDLVVLNPSASAFLAEDGITARYVPMGTYGSRRSQVPSAVSKARKNGQCIVGIVGHPYRFKRYPQAVRAFADLDSSLRENCVFAVVGGDRSLDPAGWAEIESELNKLPRDQYLVTGELDADHFTATLEDLDVALLSYTESLVGSAVGAQLAMARVPCIVTPSASFADMVKFGGAIAVDRWPEGATAALTDLLTDQARRAEMRDGLMRLEQQNSLHQTAGLMVNANN